MKPLPYYDMEVTEVILITYQDFLQLCPSFMARNGYSVIYQDDIENLAVIIR